MFKYSIYANGKMMRFTNPDRSVLLNTIQLSYKENNIIFDRAEVDKAITRQSGLLVKKSNPGLQMVVSGATAVIKNLAGSTVSNHEIVRRSAICEECPLRGKVGGCSSCGAAGKIARWANSLRAKMKLQIEIPDGVKSYFCGICQCSLALMVTTKYENFHTETEEKNMSRPDACWLKKTSPNFTNE